MSFFSKIEEKNDGDYLYNKSGDEDDRLRKECLYFVPKIKDFSLNTAPFALDPNYSTHLPKL